MTEYEALQKRLARGWNTWNTRSVLSHVLLPEGFALNLALRENRHMRYLKEAQIGRQGRIADALERLANLTGEAHYQWMARQFREERIHPGPHAYDGSYTELNLNWEGIELAVQSATDGDDLVLLVTPEAVQEKPPLLVVESGILWNRPGALSLEDGALVAHLPDRTVTAYGTQENVFAPYAAAQTPYLAMSLDGPVGVSTGKRRSVEEIREIIEQRKAEHMAQIERFGDLADIYEAVQTVMAWDTVYEPEHERVLAPVSRIWNVNWGGYVLFEWDNYFAAYMAGIDNRDLAYANAVEMTREKTEAGLVPNFATVSNCKSRDRSEPPVGALMVREIYRRFGDRWFLEEVFDNLLEWNRWWFKRRNNGGLLSWGSTPYEPVAGTFLEYVGINERQGAAWESGLDNSPMYDDVPFDQETHLMQLADVGLNSLYVADCEALADIADVLGRKAVATELRERAGAFREALTTLWDEESGIFVNRRTDTGDFSHRLAPTSFYALLAKAATQAQAERMIVEHFYNPEEFWGEWVLPSIARNDPAYPDQDYWRGRIWGPMNFLVYLGLRNYDLPQARADLAEKSKRLLLKEWLERGHVHENYCSDTGEGCNKPNSDAFYHWGGLLGVIALIEAGFLEGPEQPLAGA